MNRFAVFFCCISLFLSSLQLVVVAAEAAAQARSNGVYIVYTGAAASSSTGFDSDHILSSSSLESWKDRVIQRYSNALSGFAARLSEEEAKSIAQRPEVVSVFQDPLLQLHTTRSWDFLKDQSDVGFKPRRIPKSNSSPSGSGEDVIIGILDTGIWPEAKSFNDKGIGPIPKRWKGKCIEGPDFKPSNCNRKLIGARNYVTNDNSTSARDHDGHGTHVAAIAAGRPVPGASYHGLARGTARGGSPGSRIAVYRVCNEYQLCDGSAVLKAFDDAIADGVDVISTSFGYFEYEDYTTDPISIGAFHAVEKGIIVVASAGNAGDDPEPPRIMNVVPWILTVGATTIDRFFESDVVLGGKKVIKGGGVHSANFRETPVYPLIDGISAKDPEANDYEASNCISGTLDREKVKGKIVLCEDNDDDILPEGKLEVVTSLGGIGVIYIDHYGQLIDSVYGTSPLVPITWQDAELISSYINSTRNPVATILPTVAVAKYKPAPSVAYFSGKGPIYRNDYLIKPDIAAPGVDILSAWPSNETDEAFNILSGTSMACPHVSGIAALVKSQYPSWSPSAIKSAIMTTANPTNNLKAPITNNLGDPATPYQIGAGEVTMFGPLQPGLVYETEIADYLLFLCNEGYNISKIKLISSKLPAKFSCPSNSSEELISDMNYPSILVADFNDNKRKKVKRTMTNVGEEESIYVASVETTNEYFEVQVNPSKLHFTKEKNKLSYEVTFTHYNSSLLNGFGYGSITWSNEKYRVRIPFVVT